MEQLSLLFNKAEAIDGKSVEEVSSKSKAKSSARKRRSGSIEDVIPEGLPVKRVEHHLPEAIAHIMTQKFVMYSPLYRLEQEMNRAGLKLSRQTMSNWILHASDDWLKPIYDKLHAQLCEKAVLHADGYAGYHKLPEKSELWAVLHTHEGNSMRRCISLRLSCAVAPRQRKDSHFSPDYSG